ncbi:MAG: hypothetical protein KF819_13220 [Labilithrix sp.]|nr:hypothetical protein [Labilithrix sp.]
MRAPASLFVVALATSLVTIIAPAQAADSADRCVRIHTTERGPGLAFDVKNDCDRRLTCALTWTLSCENASGKTTSRARQESRFVVAPEASHETFGSAATCKDGWKIDDVSWDCAPAK